MYGWTRVSPAHQQDFPCCQPQVRLPFLVRHACLQVAALGSHPAHMSIYRQHVCTESRPASETAKLIQEMRTFACTAFAMMPAAVWFLKWACESAPNGDPMAIIVLPCAKAICSHSMREASWPVSLTCPFDPGAGDISSIAIHGSRLPCPCSFDSFESQSADQSPPSAHVASLLSPCIGTARNTNGLVYRNIR